MSHRVGTVGGWFPVDEVTIEYLDAAYIGACRQQGVERFAQKHLTVGRESAAPDPDAVYAARIVRSTSAR
jgi:aconitase A